MVDKRPYRALPRFGIRGRFVAKNKLEIAVSDDKADEVVEAISTSANSNKIGDGKIFVVDLNQLIRIRTGDLNEDAFKNKEIK